MISHAYLFWDDLCIRSSSAPFVALHSSCSPCTKCKISNDTKKKNDKTTHQVTNKDHRDHGKLFNIIQNIRACNEYLCGVFLFLLLPRNEFKMIWLMIIFMIVRLNDYDGYAFHLFIFALHHFIHFFPVFFESVFSFHVALSLDFVWIVRRARARARNKKLPVGIQKKTIWEIKSVLHSIWTTFLEMFNEDNLDTIVHLSFRFKLIWCSSSYWTKLSTFLDNLNFMFRLS